MEEQDRVAVMQQFGRTYRAFMSAFEAHVGQPLPRWRILLALHEQAGESSQKRLVERLRVDPGALTRQLKTLEGLGWIARSMDPRDNRVTNVRLTEAGQSATEASLPRRNAFLHDTMAALPDDALSALSGALKMLEVRIGEVAATATLRARGYGVRHGGGRPGAPSGRPKFSGIRTCLLSGKAATNGAPPYGKRAVSTRSEERFDHFVTRYDGSTTST